MSSCQNSSAPKNAETLKFLAVNSQDTARLSLTYTPKGFFGQCEIIYGKIGRDSGEVKGQLLGDTLRGEFRYLSQGGSWKRRPIALLKRHNNLHWGTGVEATLFNLPCFLPEVPINYQNSRFIFKPVK